VADVAHSEQEHEPTPFKRFEQAARNILTVNKKGIESLPKESERLERQEARSGDKVE
jgi:hypothetical protein